MFVVIYIIGITKVGRLFIKSKFLTKKIQNNNSQCIATLCTFRSKKPCGNEIISKKLFDYLRISILLFIFADIIINCQQYDIINADTSG